MSIQQEFKANTLPPQMTECINENKELRRQNERLKEKCEHYEILIQLLRDNINDLRLIKQQLQSKLKKSKSNN